MTTVVGLPVTKMLVKDLKRPIRYLKYKENIYICEADYFQYYNGGHTRRDELHAIEHFESHEIFYKKTWKDPDNQDAKFFDARYITKSRRPRKKALIPRRDYIDKVISDKFLSTKGDTESKNDHPKNGNEYCTICGYRKNCPGSSDPLLDTQYISCSRRKHFNCEMCGYWINGVCMRPGKDGRPLRVNKGRASEICQMFYELQEEDQ